MTLYEKLRAKGFSRRFLLIASVGGIVLIEGISLFIIITHG